MKSLQKPGSVNSATSALWRCIQLCVSGWSTLQTGVHFLDSATAIAFIGVLAMVCLDGPAAPGATIALKIH
jgi:hypothetical protein